MLPFQVLSGRLRTLRSHALRPMTAMTGSLRMRRRPARRTLSFRAWILSGWLRTLRSHALRPMTTLTGCLSIPRLSWASMCRMTRPTL